MASPGAPARALTTRSLDFWLLGGLSLVAWLALVVGQFFRANVAVDQHFRNLQTVGLELALLVNYPHFIVSYKLAYSRGMRFVAAHWGALVLTPVILVALLGSAFHFYATPVQDAPLAVAAARALGGWGVNAQVVSGPRVGDVLLTLAFNVMVVTIGWHYAKQVFGCVMVYARYDGYAFSPVQRSLLRWSVLAVWALAVVDNNIKGAWRMFGPFSYSSFDLPDVMLPLAEGLVLVGFVLVAWRVFYANYRATGAVPSANMLVAWIALYVWWLPQTRQEDFYFVLAPLFHSLQYLAFAYRVERGRLVAHAQSAARATVVTLSVVVMGWLAFELVPTALDERARTFDTWGLPFFFTAAMLFINIHHYFIDSVAWRLNDAPVRQYLLGD